MTTSCVRIESFLFSGNQSKFLEKSLIMVAGVLLYALLAQVSIRLPISPVPITGQTLALFLVAGVVGTRMSLLISCAYLVIGLVGFPVFAQGMGGLAALSTLSFGYLVGLVIASAIMGFFASHGYSKTSTGLIGSLILANIGLYSTGLLWMGVLAGFDSPILQWGLYPFIIGDLLKMALAFSLITPLKKYIYK